MNYIKLLPPRWHIIGKNGLCCEGNCIKNNNNNSSNIDNGNGSSSITTSGSITFNTSGMYCNDDFDDMKGPLDTTNWIVKDSILCGEYPGVKDDNEHFKTLSTLLDNGIRVFVCLQEEQELKKFRSYKEDILKLSNDKGINVESIEFVHFPMEDGGVADSLEDLSELIEKLLSHLSNGNKIYLHCWAGRGRTGIIGACLLGRLYQVTGLDALRRTQDCYQQRVIGYGESPEYHPQKMQVIKYLRSKNELTNSNSSSN